MLDKDHDLLIEIATQMKDLRADVKDIKTNTVGRIEKLEIEKANDCDLDKLKERTNSLENWRWYIIGISTAVWVIVGFLIKLA